MNNEHTPKPTATPKGILPPLPDGRDLGLHIPRRARYGLCRVAGSDELQVYGITADSGYSLQGFSAEELYETLLEIIRGEISVEVDP
jgi:hypothetical protein